MLLLNLLLALAWLLLTGQFTPVNFIFGYIVGFVMLRLFWQAVGAESINGETPRYFRKVRQVIVFVGFFLWELWKANLRVAADVLRLQPRMQPAIVAVPLDRCTDEEVTLLANLITLTPGTLSVDVAESDGENGATGCGRTLFVHAMHAGRTPEEIAQFRQDLKNTFERHVQEVMR
jgi:multicomponent Na+:H+ antiporter subunit E